jgi:hypothetical protein
VLGVSSPKHADQVDVGSGFIPLGRDVGCVPDVRDAPIAELLGELHFVERKRNWGMLARRWDSRSTLETWE